MGKIPLNLADDTTITSRIHGTDTKGVVGKSDAADGLGNYNKISGHHGSVKSKNYQVSKATPSKGHPGPNKKGVGATSYSNGAVKTALNIVRK